MLKDGYIAYPRKNMKLLIDRGTSSSTPEPEGAKSIPMQDYNRAHRQELSPHWPASHLMKWGCWRCPTELSVAGRKLMKENHSCHRKKKKSPQANYCMEYGTFYILKRPLCLRERYGGTGNGGLRNSGDTEYTLRYSINKSFSSFFCFSIAHTHMHVRAHTHTHTHTRTDQLKSPDGLLTRKREQSQPDTGRAECIFWKFALFSL